MTDEVSKARQALRDYAREQVPDTILHVRRTDDVEGVPSTQQLQVAVGLGTRGEAAGKTFMAVQAALTVAEELRAEGEEPVTTKVEMHGRLAPYPPDVHYRRAQREAANRIELAILKVLN
jgi:hypothetical protein